ncbi:mn2+/fe2+ transporter, nramp family [Candidatus Protofrankia californiensis]|uniref:Mn2+/fe2+ transporter, nramp family n=1 Tax=Candidatus Protofrankia californiensis TaxID=1839754 RepID=A0A1C3PAP9_9ACTN|nr:mn2+/fe2+ transporter, nramp family [Candidatus Protofrankia californiensis]
MNSQLDAAARCDLQPATPPPIDPDSGRGYLGRGRVLGLIGPAFVAAVAFVDPGNFGTNVSAGASYGYLLLWAVVVANLMAVLVQYLSAKLGLATGCSLAEVCREHTSTPVRIGLWLVAEFVVVMTDLAEFVGGAIALELLFGISLLVGGLVITAVTLLVLRLRVRGLDGFPAVIVALLFLIVFSMLYLLVAAPPHVAEASAGLIPHFSGTPSAVLACGIVGATVMPHAVFLHSALIGGLHDRGATTIRTPAMLRFIRRDVVIAMGLAGVVNATVLVVATRLPASAGESLHEAHAAFTRSEGEVFATVFAVALLGSGLASASAGVYSGQAIMQGFLRRKSSVFIRRMISSVPALVILAVIGDPTKALVFSQVALAFGLPFALVPLVVFTARRSVMGAFVNRRWTTTAVGLIAAVIASLNVFLIIDLAIA